MDLEELSEITRGAVCGTIVNFHTLTRQSTGELLPHGSFCTTTNTVCCRTAISADWLAFAGITLAPWLRSNCAGPVRFVAENVRATDASGIAA